MANFFSFDAFIDHFNVEIKQLFHSQRVMGVMRAGCFVAEVHLKGLSVFVLSHNLLTIHDFYTTHSHPSVLFVSPAPSLRGADSLLDTVNEELSRRC